MRNSVLKSTVFVAVAIAISGTTGPPVGIVAAMVGRSSVPLWVYGGTVSVLLGATTFAALILERTGFKALGLVQPVSESGSSCSASP